MKLLRLDLVAFGPLQNAVIDLASEAPCLHVVYGPNEAGKSTALRALQGLFYGIPEATPDAHRFRASELRVAALLQDARGRELYVVRRKGRKQTLAAADGTPLAGADASWITAGMPEAQFRSMFALSYDTLEQGADELLGSAGELGQSLFSAGTGGAGAHAVLESLRQEADALYRPRGRTQRLNAALTAFEEARRSVREQSIRAEAFVEQQRSIELAEAETSRLQLQRQQLVAERVRFERARRVLPLLAKRAELQRQRAELGDVPPLPESAAEDRRLLERARRDASLRLEHVDAEVAKLAEAMSALHVDDAWLEPVNQVQLSELRDRLLQYRRAQRTLPVRRDALARARAELQAMLERLGLRVEFADIESLRVSRPLEAKIREQARAGEMLVSRCAELTRQIAAKRDEAAKQRGALVARRFDPQGTVRQIELPLSPERVSLSLDQVTEFERAAAELEREQRACADRLRAEEDALERALRDLEALANAGEPPTEQQLTAAREERRQLMTQLREALERSEGEGAAANGGDAEGADVRGAGIGGAVAGSEANGGDEGAAGVRGAANGGAVAGSAASGGVASGADAVDAVAGGVAGVGAAAADEAPVTSVRAPRARDVRAAMNARARRPSQPTSPASGFAPAQTAPALLRALERQTEAADVIADRLRREATRVAEFARLQAAHAGSQRVVEKLRLQAAGFADRVRVNGERWIDICSRAGVAPRAPALMRAFLTEHRAEALRLDSLEREASRLERELEAEAARRDAWRTSWNELVTQIGSPAGASVSEVEAMLTGLADVFARLDATRTDSREIEVLAHEVAAFERELTALQGRLLPEAAPGGWDSIADQLLARDHAERRAAERRSQFEAQLGARREERERAQHELASTDRELTVLMEAAGVHDLGALEAAEEAARRARMLDESLAQIRAELLAAADGFEPAELEQELGDTSVPEVVARLQEVEDALERLEAERESALHTLEARRAGLARLCESRGAADAALDAGAELENVRLLAQRYVRVKLAYGVLAREVERYRERHTGPILRGASALFSRLTHGAWRGLEADFGDSDEPVLVCVRDDGDRVGVRGLSAGTRDQLYLALRLASIEQLSAARELMPLVLDDLLVHFDDDRASAALGALGEFAKVTQVLLFTHHQRVCELAREAVPEPMVRVHRLGSQPAAVRELPLFRAD